MKKTTFFLSIILISLLLPVAIQTADQEADWSSLSFYEDESEGLLAKAEEHSAPMPSHRGLTTVQSNILDFRPWLETQEDSIKSQMPKSNQLDKYIEYRQKQAEKDSGPASLLDKPEKPLMMPQSASMHSAAMPSRRQLTTAQSNIFDFCTWLQTQEDSIKKMPKRFQLERHQQYVREARMQPIAQEEEKHAPDDLPPRRADVEIPRLLVAEKDSGPASPLDKPEKPLMMPQSASMHGAAMPSRYQWTTAHRNIANFRLWLQTKDDYIKNMPKESQRKRYLQYVREARMQSIAQEEENHAAADLPPRSTNVEVPRLLATDQNSDSSLLEALNIVRKSSPVLQKLMFDDSEEDVWNKETEIPYNGPRDNAYLVPTQDMIISRDYKGVYFTDISKTIGYGDDFIYCDEDWGFQLSPDESCAAVLNMGSHKGENGLFLMNLKTKERRLLFMPNSDQKRTMAFSPDGSRLAISDAKTVSLWNPTHLGNFQEHTDYVDQLIFTKSDPLLISASMDGIIKIWNYNARVTKTTIQTSQGWMRRLKLSSDDTRLLSLEDDIKLWDVNTGELLGTQQGEYINDAYFCPTGEDILFTDLAKLRIWTPTTNDVHKYNITRNNSRDAISFSSDGSLAMVPTKEGLQLINLATKEETHLLIDVDAGVDSFYGKYMTCPQFQGSQVISGNDKGMIKFWNTQTGDCTLTLNAHNGHEIRSILFYPDSSQMISITGERNCSLWHKRRKRIAALIAKKQHEEEKE